MKYVITVFICLASVTMVSALNMDQQDHHNLEERAQSRLEFLSIVLDLSTEQLKEMEEIQDQHLESVRMIKDNYKPVIEKMKTELEVIRKGTENSFEESRDKAKAVRDKYDADLSPMRDELDNERTSLEELLSKVFSNDQYEKYQALKELKARSKSKHGKKGPHQRCR